MSDTSQGPGWWIASDGKWYSPEQKPGPAPEPPAAEAVAPAEPAVPAPVAPDPVAPGPVAPVEAPGVVAPVNPSPVAPETPPLAGEPPTEPIPVTPPPAATPPPSYVPPPMAAPPSVPPGGPPPMVTPPAGGYGAPPVAGSVAAAPVKQGNGCLKAVLIVGAIIAVLIIAVFVLLAFVVNKGVDTLSDKLEAQEEVESRTGIHSNSFNTEHPPQDDLVDWTCTSTPNGFPLVTGTVKNNSSQTSTYTIIVEFKQNGAEFTSGTGLVVSVDPDRTADFTATGSVEPAGQFTCRIDTIDRFDIDLDTGN